MTKNYFSFNHCADQEIQKNKQNLNTNEVARVDPIKTTSKSLLTFINNMLTKENRPNHIKNFYN